MEDDVPIGKVGWVVEDDGGPEMSIREAQMGEKGESYAKCRDAVIRKLLERQREILEDLKYWLGATTGRKHLDGRG